MYIITPMVFDYLLEKQTLEKRDGKSWLWGKEVDVSRIIKEAQQKDD